MPFWNSIGNFFRKAADDVATAASAVGTVAEDAGKTVAAAAVDVGKGIEHAGEAVAKASSDALTNVCNDVTGAVQGIGRGDPYATLNDGLGAAGLPSATNAGMVSPLIPAADRPFLGLLNPSADQGANDASNGVAMSDYLARVRANFGSLGLQWGPEQEAAAQKGALSYPWIDSGA